MWRPRELAGCLAILGACTLGVLTTATAAYAPTSLIVIPTAETLGARKYRVAAQARGAELGVGRRTWVLKTKFGLGARAEAGVNVNPGSDDDILLLWHAKYVFPVQQHNRTVAGVGFTSLGNRSKFAPYAVATHSLRKAHVHLGLVRDQSVVRFFVGADRKLGELWLLMADFTNGTGNFASAGAEYTLGDRWQVRSGVLIPNDGGRPRLSAEFKYTVRY